MNYAFVTVLSTNDYYKGVVALFESIKETKSKYGKYVVLVNETIQEDIIRDFISRGYDVIRHKKMQFDFVKNEFFSYWQNTFDKFSVFDLEQFDKIVFLDSDMLVTHNIDCLFELPHMSAVVAGKELSPDWNCLNSGLMVIVPKKDFSLQLIDTLKNNNYSNEIGDQDVIETYFDWQSKGLAISENYNMFADTVDYYINHLNYKKEEISVIHFIGKDKPWMLDKNQQELFRQDCLSNNNIYLLDYFDQYLSIINQIDNY